MDTTSVPSRRTVERPRSARLGPRAGRVAVAALVSVAVLAVSAVILAAVPALFGWRTLVVTSGSMEPEIRAGDAVFLREGIGHSTEVGDLVTFRPLRGEGLTTHRVLAHRDIGGTLHLQTKGDANAAPDPNLVPADNVLGTVVFHAPGLGTLLAHASSGLGLLILIGIPATLLILDAVRCLREEGSPSSVG